MRSELWALAGLACAACVSLDRPEVPVPSFVADRGPQGPDAGDAAAVVDARLLDAEPADAAADGAVVDAGVDAASDAALDLGPDGELDAEADRGAPDAAPDLAVEMAPDVAVVDMEPPCEPAAERCDGVDNDCDGVVDEEARGPAGLRAEGEPCEAQVADCRIDGVWWCEAAAWRCHMPTDAALRDQVDAVSGCGCSRPVNGIINDQPYMLCQNNQTWADAAAVCEAAGLRLLVVTPDDLDALASGGPQWPRRFWVGLSDAAVEGEFEWLDGAPLDGGGGLRWDVGEPSDETGAEDCGQLDRATMRLRVLDCAERDDFVCGQIPAER